MRAFKSLLIVSICFSAMFLQNCGIAQPVSRAQAPETVPIETPEPNPDAFAKQGHLIRYSEIEDLRQKGLKDPIEDIVKSLAANSKVIPFKGVLGGTMSFYDEQGMHLLSPNWVYAKFDDGHVLGHGVFEYQIKKDGSLTWKAVKAQLDK